MLNTWPIASSATLGGGWSAAGKFFYSPDVVHARTFTAVHAGQRQPTQPLALTTNDRFYTLFDYRVGKGAGVAGAIIDADPPAEQRFLCARDASVPGATCRWTRAARRW